MKNTEFPEHGAVVHWKIGGILRVVGADAAIFLQGQFTNDIRGLAPGLSVYGLWLNQKGKVLADGFVLAGPGPSEFWVVSYFSSGDELRQRLEAYIIADDVTVEDQTAEWEGVTLFGAGAGDWIASKRRPGLIFPGRRTRDENWDWVFRKDDAPAVVALLSNVRTMEGPELERLRIRSGIPAVPADLGPGDLPAEGGLEVEAISCLKGCYLGQEVMARLKAMGQVRRRLVRVCGKGVPPPVPAKLTQGSKPVGELRSVVRNGSEFLGLAMISLLNVQKDQPLVIENQPALSLEIVAETP